MKVKCGSTGPRDARTSAGDVTYNRMKPDASLHLHSGFSKVFPCALAAMFSFFFKNFIFKILNKTCFPFPVPCGESACSPGAHFSALLKTLFGFALLEIVVED